MSTQNITPSNAASAGKSSKKDMATKAGIGVAAAAVGAAGATFANNLSDKPEEMKEQVAEEVAQETTEQENQETAPQQEATPAPQPAPQPAAEQPEVIEPTPITETPEVTVTEPQPQNVDEPVNPDEIADAIIAGEEIDPNDIDTADVVNFEDIGTVYTVGGESYTAASFHGPEGEELLMVDVDGDDIFDVVTTPEGDIICQAGGMTVGDAEVMINEEPTYLAQNESQEDELPTGESFMDDIISV